MSRITDYVVLPFIRTSEGALTAIEAEESEDVAKAKHRAFNCVGEARGTDVVVGAIAFSRSSDPATGNVEDALVLARYGETPDGNDVG